MGDFTAMAAVYVLTDNPVDVNSLEKVTSVRRKKVQLIRFGYKTAIATVLRSSPVRR